jgi:hypothetical protein
MIFANFKKDGGIVSVSGGTLTKEAALAYLQSKGLPAS